MHGCLDNVRYELHQTSIRFRQVQLMIETSPCTYSLAGQIVRIMPTRVLDST